MSSDKSSTNATGSRKRTTQATSPAKSQSKSPATSQTKSPANKGNTKATEADDRDSLYSSPCLLDEHNPDIDPHYLGYQEFTMVEVLASNTIIYCRHWQAMVAFYRDLLGFRKTFVREDWFIELRVNGDSHISLADETRCTVKSTSGEGITLSFKVAELAKVRAVLEEGGASPGQITSHSWRAPYFYVHDPEGNRIEFWSTTA